MAQSQLLVKSSLIRTMGQCHKCCIITFHFGNHVCFGKQNLAGKKKSTSKERDSKRQESQKQLNDRYVAKLQCQPFVLTPCEKESRWYLAHITSEEWFLVLAPHPEKMTPKKLQVLLKLVMQDARNWNVVLPKNQVSLRPILLTWKDQQHWTKCSTMVIVHWLCESILAALCLDVPSKPWCMDVYQITPLFRDAHFLQELVLLWVQTSQDGWKRMSLDNQIPARPPAPLLLDQDKDALLRLWTGCK